MLGRGDSKKYKAFDKKNQRTVMITRTPLDEDPMSAPHERDNLFRCSYPFIAKYYGAIVKDNELWVCIWIRTAYD